MYPSSRRRNTAAKPGTNSACSTSNDKKRNSILNGGLFSKRRYTTASTNRTSHIEPTAEATTRGIVILQSMFPTWDSVVLQMLLEANGYVMEDAITCILHMGEIDEENSPQCNQHVVNNGFSSLYPIKNQLPIDFLRLPDDDGCLLLDDELRSDEERDDDEGEDIRPSEYSFDELVDRTLYNTNDIENENKDMIDPSSLEQSVTIAQDDGTKYGKELMSSLHSPNREETLSDEDTGEGVDEGMFREEALRMMKNQSIVDDSMNQKFLPLELRTTQHHPLENRDIETINDTANVDSPTTTLPAMKENITSSSLPTTVVETAITTNTVIKRSKLDLTEAEKRIRHREPHLVFELLSKASEIYRNGIISSPELELLRSMIVSRIQPTKMLLDTSRTINEMISDHEWQLLILKAKGIRQALSIRIIDCILRYGHMEYWIRIVDIESGVVWFTRKRFKELHKLYRKLSRLSTRVNESEFPARRHQGRVTTKELAQIRAPVLESFLRTAASLVTAQPMSFLHGCALKHMQQFLEVPHEGILLRNRTQPISRELRVFVYHTVNDRTTPEGKACSKFLMKATQCGVDPGKSLLEEIGTVLDGVQEYMLEHRFEEMRIHVERLLAFYNKEDLESRGGKPRCNSYVNSILRGDDINTSQDKLQQLISDAIRHELEENICIPLLPRVLAALTRQVSNKERQFKQQVSILRDKPQSYFGIGVNKISVSSWGEAVALIREMDDAFLPLDKLRKLVATAHQIHALHRSEKRAIQMETSGSNDDCPDDVLSGDDFLPIFIYVIVQSDLKTPILTQILLNRLCDPEKRRSESGYYLATFEAAVHHILSVEVV